MNASIPPTLFEERYPSLGRKLKAITPRTSFFGFRVDVPGIEVDFNGTLWPDISDSDTVMSGVYLFSGENIQTSLHPTLSTAVMQSPWL